jgi:hypothetical protein
MTGGLILLALIAVAGAYGYTKMRGKMKLPIASKHWKGAIIVIALVLLVMYAAAHGSGK